MSSRLLKPALAALIFALVYLVGEGVLALSRGYSPDTSLAFRALSFLRAAPVGDDSRLYRPVLTDLTELEALFEVFRENGVALGNSHYEELMTEAAAVNRTAGSCLELRPNVRKKFTFLRTSFFETFNPLVLFYDAGRELPPVVENFIDRYAERLITFSTNSLGERTTVPLVEAEDMVLVAGDSVALGAMVEDRETLASVLQRRDPQRQYVNLGIGGADAWEIQCALKRAGERYPGRIRKLIYLFCENDFDEDETLGTPEKAMAALVDWVRRHRVDDTVVVYAPYIYNVVPSFTRLRGERGERFDFNADEKARLEALVRQAGFGWIDFGALPLAESKALGTRFGALSLYVDVVHLSPQGALRLADALEARAGL
jgi:hypothetical protein